MVWIIWSLFYTDLWSSWSSESKKQTKQIWNTENHIHFSISNHLSNCYAGNIIYNEKLYTMRYYKKYKHFSGLLNLNYYFHLSAKPYVSSFTFLYPLHVYIFLTISFFWFIDAVCSIFHLLFFPLFHCSNISSCFQMFVRLFVDENLDRMVPISKQPKEKIQAIIESCSRQFPEFQERARKRIRTYLKSCRRMKKGGFEVWKHGHLHMLTSKNTHLP